MTTPRILMMFGWWNCPMMAASCRNLTLSPSLAPPSIVFTATSSFITWSEPPWPEDKYPLYTLPNAPLPRSSPVSNLQFKQYSNEKCKPGPLVHSLQWFLFYRWHTQILQLRQELFLHAGRFKVRLVIIMAFMVFGCCRSSCVVGWEFWGHIRRRCLSKQGIFVAQLVVLGWRLFLGVMVVHIDHSLPKICKWQIVRFGTMLGIHQKWFPAHFLANN